MTTQMRPISTSIPGAVSMTGLTRTRIYGLLSEGKLKARKSGRRTLIMVDSLMAYIESLPERATTNGRC
jgi:excisionase family DNA binding protein